MPGSTISNTISGGITLGSSGYASPLSITAHGEVKNSIGSGIGILISSFANGTVANDGSISAGHYGIYLTRSDAVILNSGTISAGSAGIKTETSASAAAITNTGLITGEYAIRGSYITLTNSGNLAGTSGGVRLANSTVANNATISGSDIAVYLNNRSTLINHADITSGSIALELQNAYAANFGTLHGNADIGSHALLINHGTILGDVLDSAGSFQNPGTVIGTSSGLVVDDGLSVSNLGIIQAATGVFLAGNTGYLENSGTISGVIGVDIARYGNLTNAGFISGSGVGVVSGAGTVHNSGEIKSGDLGVRLFGYMVNTGLISGSITGVADYVTFSNYGTVYGGRTGVTVSNISEVLKNFGEISGKSIGVAGYFAGSITNYAVISGGKFGVSIQGEIVTNAGTISGGVDAIYGQKITLAVDPGAQFIGQVVNAAGPAFLDLGLGRGSLGGIGSQFTGFSEITFAATSEWSLAGNEAGLALGQTIAGFTRADTIVLDGFSASTHSYVSGTGLELSNGTAAETLGITGNFSTSSFLVTESANNTTITAVTCFVAGTRIATPAGEIAVEALRIGDLVRTQHAGAQPVKWIGQRSYAGSLIRGNKAALPICIKAGAIADRVPARDLWVSPGHAISIDHMLVHASRLVNGVSVIQAQAVEQISYFHIELENHEIVFAENCPAETFMDETFRRQFQNAEAFHQRYPGHKAPMAMCQPRLEHGFLLHAIQRRLNERAGVKPPAVTGKLRGYIDGLGPKTCYGWAQDIAAPEAPVCLDILCAGQRIGRVLANQYRQDVQAAGLGSGYQGFEFLLPPTTTGRIQVRRSSDRALLEMAATTSRAA